MGKRDKQKAVRKEFIKVSADRYTYNPITGDYYGKPGNRAFQELVTKADGAMYMERYTHHTRRPLAGPATSGACADCKPISLRRRETLVREGQSVAKHASRGSIRDIFKSHDGYEKALVAALPDIVGAK